MNINEQSKDLKGIIFVAEHQTDLSLKLRNWLNNNDEIVIDIQYTATRGFFSVLIIYKES